MKDPIKFSHIEPAVFAGFAKEMVSAADEVGVSELDERDPNSPYRDSALNRALSYEQTRMNSSGAPPRQDYARTGKLAGVASRAAGLVSQRTARKFQEDLEGIFGGEDTIPGSSHLVPGGLEYGEPTAAKKKFLLRKYKAKE